MKCWGWNYESQLGDGTLMDRYTPVNVSGLSSGGVGIAINSNYSCALDNVGAVRCWGGLVFGRYATPLAIPGLSGGVAAIAAGGYHSCALTSAGAVLCWGGNDLGQLGDGTLTLRASPVPVYGLSSGVAAIDAGYAHSCALTNAGGVKCWGWNYYGQLGIGPGGSVAKFRTRPQNVIGLSSGVAAVAADYGHTCASTAAGALRCWGYNSYGQLGDGSTTWRDAPVSTVGISSLVRAQAQFSSTLLGAGLHTLRARYPGDASHMQSLGTRSQTVN